MGAALATGASAMSGWSIEVHWLPHRIGMILIGSSVGLTLTPEIASAMLGQLPLMLAAAGLDILAAVDWLHLCRAKGPVRAGGLAVSNREHRKMVDALAAGDKLRAQEAFSCQFERSKRRFKLAAEADAQKDRAAKSD